MRLYKNIAIVLTLLLTIGTISSFAANKTSGATNEDPGVYRMQGSPNLDFFDKEAPTKNSKNINTTAFGSSHNARFNGYSIEKGIDISHWNNTIDWKKVKASGIKFAIISVGYRGYEKGTLVEDSMFKKNIQGAIAAGVPVGVYIFSQAITEKEGIAEANFILQRVKGYKISLPLVLDYEYVATGVGRLYKANLSRTATTNISLAFCNTIRAAGYTPMVYANKNMLETKMYDYKISAKNQIWLAHYTSKTDYAGSYSYWQYTSDGSVGGISGRVDLNYRYTRSSSTPVDLSKTSVSIANQSYTGRTINPSVRVSYGSRVLVQNKDYKVTSTNNTAIGVASATITPLGKNTGSKSTTFKIVPKTITGLTYTSRGKTHINMKWNKGSNVDGYNVYRASSPNGTYHLVKTTTATTYQSTGLTSSREYYYRVRAYKKISGDNYYSNPPNFVKVYTLKPYSKTATYKSQGYLRSNPGYSYSAVKLIPKNAKAGVYCYTYDKSGNVWQKVKYTKNGKSYIGYTKGSLLSVKATGRAAKKTIIRIGPSKNYKGVKSLPKNQKVTINSLKKDKTGTTWYRVSYSSGKKTYKGYVYSPYIK